MRVGVAPAAALLVLPIAFPALVASCERGRPAASGGSSSASPGADSPAPSPGDLVKSGRFAEAEARLRGELARSGPAAAQRGQTRHLLALALAGQGRFDEALAEIGQAEAVAAANPEVQRAFANILMKLGRHGEAAERYRRALRLAEQFQGRTGLPVPDLHRWRYELGQALMRAGRTGEARRELALYEEAQRAEIELRGLEREAKLRDTAGAHAARGRALQQSGKHREAADAFRAAIGKDPGHAPAHLGLALVILDALAAGGSAPDARGALGVAREHALRALASEESAAARLALARAERLGGDLRAAEEAIARALELAPGDASVPRQVEDIRGMEPLAGPP